MNNQVHTRERERCLDSGNVNMERRAGMVYSQSLRAPSAPTAWCEWGRVCLCGERRRLEFWSVDPHPGTDAHLLGDRAPAYFLFRSRWGSLLSVGKSWEGAGRVCKVQGPQCPEEASLCLSSRASRFARCFFPSPPGLLMQEIELGPTHA